MPAVRNERTMAKITCLTDLANMKIVQIVEKVTHTCHIGRKCKGHFKVIRMIVDRHSRAFSNFLGLIVPEHDNLTNQPTFFSAKTADEVDGLQTVKPETVKTETTFVSHLLRIRYFFLHFLFSC